MRRREFLAALSLGGVGLSSGCLSAVRESTRCSATEKFGVAVVNHRFSEQTVHVELRTPFLGREVFAESFEMPAATDNEGRTYHPETVYEPNIAANLRSYDVIIRYADKTHTYSWRVTCEHLYVEVRGEDEPWASVVTREREPKSDTR